MPPGKRRQDLEEKARRLFAAIPCEALPEAAADQYARIKREAALQGTLLDENDLWIAATAQSLDATLVTLDSDFQRIQGLAIETWTV